MGANCCVATKSTASVSGTGIGVSVYRDDRYMPSWSFQHDNGTHIEGSVSRQRFSCGASGNLGTEVKSFVDTEAVGISNAGNPVISFHSTRWQKSPSFGASAGITINRGERDMSIGSSSIEDDALKLSTNHGWKITKSFTFSPSSMFKADASSVTSSLRSDSMPPRKAHGSPSSQLSRQSSDSRMPILTSHSMTSPSNKHHSFALPNYGSELFTEGSNWSSSENWSMDADNCSGYGKSSLSNHHHHQSQSAAGLQKCGICSKGLKERPWSGFKFVSIEIPVVAILVCGHVYHADCLENMTSEIERLDPSCPVCANGGNHESKLLTKVELKSMNKISRIAAASIVCKGEFDVDHRKGSAHGGNGQQLASSSRIKESFSKPSLTHHFSLGSKILRVSSGNDGTRKKGFWFKHR